MASKVFFLLFLFSLCLSFSPVQPRTVKSLNPRKGKSDCEACIVDIQSILTNLVLIRKQDVPSLDQVCRQLASTEKLCENYIDMINATFEILEDNINPREACTFYGICSDSHLTEVSKTVFKGERENSISPNQQKQTGKKEEELKFSVCSQCQAITRYIEEQVADYKTEEEIAEFIKKDVCGRLPNPVLRETCQSFMVEYGDAFIYKIALKLLDPSTVCSKEFHVCPKITVEKSVEKSSEIEIFTDSVDSTCNLCVDMVRSMESLISNGNLENSEIMNQACSQFESKERVEKCKILYDAFGPHFTQMIAFDSPKKICSAVDICYNGTNTHLLGGQKCTFGPSYWCHTVNHANACKASNYCRKNVWKPIKEKVETSNVQDTPQCVLCHLLLHIVDRELEKNSTVEEIENVLENACKKIYKDEAKLAQCQERVDKYTKRFIDLATQGVAPEVACIIFGFCEVGEDAASVACLRDEKVSCPICKSVIEKVYETLSDNKTREEIDEALERSCNLLPDSQRQACLVYIKVYDERLAELIAETADAEEVCRKVDLCSEHDEVMVESEPEKLADPECMLCKRVFEYIYAYLQENRTQGAIEDALDKVCEEVFPSGRKKACRKFVDTYTAQIIDIVLQTTDPKEACVLLGMCKQSNRYTVEGQEEIEEIVDIVPMTTLIRHVTPKPNASPQEECDRCNKTVSWMAQHFQNTATTLNAELQNACESYVKDSSKCKSYMQTYFDSATNSLISQTSIDYLCINLFTMCPANKSAQTNSAVNLLEKNSNNEVEFEGKRTSL